MFDIVEIETLVLELLLIVSIVAILVRRFRIPYTVALVLVGFALSFRTAVTVELTSEIILFLFIPPLVFEAAFHLDLRQLRQDVSTIAVLAIAGVVISMIIVAGILFGGAGLPWEIALVFGALIAATDPVSVVAIFRKLGAPKRLEVLLESESLFNDGTAIVLFGIALGAFQIGHLNLVDGMISFIVVSGGGIVIGLGLGWVVSRLIASVDDYLIEITLTTVLAFGSYLVAEQVHMSGVLAVVAAGLVTGNISEKEMSPTTRIVVFNFWEYVAFLANSAVFLLIGLEIEAEGLIGAWRYGLWAIVAVLIARAISVYALARLGRKMPEKWRHVLFWGGLRGAIALALALSLPASMAAYRELLTVMAFTVVLFTLVFQGMSMETLLKRLGLITRTEEQMEYELRNARAISLRASFDHLENLHDEGLISNHTWERLHPVLQQRVEALTSAVQEALLNSPELEADELITARREVLRSQRIVLNSLRTDGVIGQDTYEELVAEVDIALDAASEEWTRQIFEEQIMDDIRFLFMVVVQSRDLENVLNALSIRNIPTTLIQSSGGFLRHTNHLLLVGVPEGKLNQTVDAIENASQSRTEYVSAPFGKTGNSLMSTTEVHVRGATIFVIDVERCEVI